jgi:hypothetical protein
MPDRRLIAGDEQRDYGAAHVVSSRATASPARLGRVINIDQTARRHLARFWASLSEQQICLNLNCRLRQCYLAALDAKVA